MFKKLFRILFVRADKLFPKSWWCGACQEMHYRDLNFQNWKKP